MNFIEHYFINRIDHALDHAQPLDGWTAWYIRRNPKLWEYYTDMLKLELELRFPDTESDNNNADNNNANNSNNNNSVSSNHRNRCRNNLTNPQLNPQQIYRKRHWRNYLFKNRVWISAAVIFVVVLLTVLTLRNFSEQNSENTGTPLELAESTNDQKIDLGDVFDELFAVVPLGELVPSIENPFEIPYKISYKISFEVPVERRHERSFENSLLEFPAEPIVRFTDCPLESTLTFLETAGIVRSSNHERD
ncbi:MAG: hypothetical protein LBU34_02005 [Planctomycetaceae bacterium]|jgi:hypothetical protein|nr:hypothetical protein [Planctomycetaceae bacterium]